MQKKIITLCLLFILLISYHSTSIYISAEHVDELSNTLCGSVVQTHILYDGNFIRTGDIKLEGYVQDNLNKRYYNDDIYFSFSCDYSKNRRDYYFRADVGFKTVYYDILETNSNKLLYSGQITLDIGKVDSSLSYNINVNNYSIKYGEQLVAENCIRDIKNSLNEVVTGEYIIPDTKKNKVGYHKITITFNPNRNKNVHSYETIKIPIKLEVLPIITLKSTTTTITSTYYKTCEYSINKGKTWQSSNIFRKLDKDTEYTVYCRFKATDEYEAGTIIEETITTKK